MKLLVRLLKLVGYSGAVLATLLFIIVLIFLLAAKFRETGDRHDLAPKNGSFVDAGDIEMFIQEAGTQDGRVVVLIGGTGAYSEFWSETSESLAQEGYRVIALDVPPFGYSEIPENKNYGNIAQAKRIISLLDNMGINKATFIGHSFGGGATLETALTIPQRIESLILVDVGGLNFKSEVLKENVVNPILKTFLNNKFLRNPVIAAAGTNPLLTKKLLSMMVYNPSDATPEKVRLLQAPLSLKKTTNTMGDWLTYVMLTKEDSLTVNPENYKSLTIPTLIIWGDKDTVIPIQEGEYLKGIIPSAKMTMLPNINHIPQIEDFPRFVDEVKSFLSTQL